MTTRIAISALKAANIMFEEGLTVDQVKTGIDNIRQPSKGFYYPADIYKYIKDLKECT